MTKKLKKSKKRRSHQKKAKPLWGAHSSISLQKILQQAANHHQAGRFRQAEALYRQILSTDPDHPEALYFLGLLAYQHGRNSTAIDLISKALNGRPDFAEAHNDLGNAFLAQGRLADAVASYRQALQLKPDYARAHYNMGVVLQTQAKREEAVVSYRQALNFKPDYVEAHYNLGIVLKELGRLEDAAASYRQALLFKPDLAEAHNNLGVIYSETGRMEEAVSSFKKALAINANFVLAYKGLATVEKFTADDDIIKTMERLYANNKISDTDRKDLGFSLGKILENLGDYEKSFHYLHEANILKRKSYTYSIKAEGDFFARIKKIFSPDFFASHADSGEQDLSPFFILGMPRSGTSLVEQILASHSAVFGAGELPFLSNLARNVCPENKSAQFPECLLELGEHVFKTMGRDYIKKIREYSKAAKHITDKMPHNFLYLGLIKIILPRAKVIHCTRNPMDICFSIYKNDFKGTVAYAYDLVELGHYYNLYSELMAYWEEALPGFIYTLEYEKMISDQQKQTRELLDFCALPWEEACLDFHKTERSINTVSLTQVRQPIYKESIQRWRNYEKQLEPLRAIIFGK
jgi:tetratricopeptide (TPR) repeat protein